MTSLLVIGFGLLVLAVRLMTLRNNLRRAGNVQTVVANEVLREGLIICVGGLIVLIIGISGSLLSIETRILTDTGAAVIYIGLLSIIQWVVQRGKGNEQQVRKWAWVVAYIGLACILAYVIYRIITIFN